MKTIILLFVFVISFAVTTLSSPIKGETDPRDYKHPLIDLYKKVHAGHSTMTLSRAKQTSQFLLNSVEHQGWDGESFSSHYKVDHIYQSGRRTETTHSDQSFLEEGWVVSSRELFLYENDRLSSIVSQTKIGESFQNDYRVVFTYQLINGQYFIHETTYQFWNGSQSIWVNEERTVLIASNGTLSMGESSAWIDDDWYTYELIFFEQVDDDLNLTIQEPYGHMWVNTERQIFLNFTIDDLYSLFINEFNTVESGSFLEFVEMMPDYIDQYWTGADWLDVERQVTEVDYNLQTGEMISKQISGQYFEEEWITYTEIMITYEDGIKSEMVLSFVDDSEQGVLAPIFAEQLEYNEQGLILYIIQKQVNGGFEKTAQQNELVVFGRLMFQWGGVSTSIEKEIRPVAFSLGNAYPNPFNPSTLIPFEAQTNGEVTIRIFDMLGRQVATLAQGTYPAGSHTVRFDASGLSSGVYMVRMTAPGAQQIRRVTLLK